MIVSLYAYLILSLGCVYVCIEYNAAYRNRPSGHGIRRRSITGRTGVHDRQATRLRRNGICGDIQHDCKRFKMNTVTSEDVGSL